MKVIKSLSIFLFMVISCDLTDSGDGFITTTALSLSVGNKYMFSHSSSLDGSINHASWYTNKNIVSDTLINERTYYKFDNGRIFRSDNKAIYSFESGEEKTYFNFDIKVGDIVLFENKNYKVTELKNKNILGESVLSIAFSNHFFNSDTLLSHSISKKFGITSSSYRANGYSTGYSLVGAVIDSVAYGRL